MTKDSTFYATERANAPDTPATNQWGWYFKSGGWYYIDDAGTELQVAALSGAASFLSVTITGTGGAGYLQLANQASNPSTPTSSGRVFFDSSNRLSWKDTDGFVTTFDSTGISADRVYTLPNVAGTVTLIDATQTLTNKTLTAPTIADFTNMAHDHLDADDGGTLTTAAIASGTFDNARINWAAPSAYGSGTPAAVSATTLTTTGAVIFNDAGADVDHRMETDNDPNAFFLDGGLDFLGIGTAAPTGKVTIQKGAIASAGADLVINGTFAADSDWTKGTDWTISGGAANKTAGSAANLTQNLGEAAGEMYRIRFDYTRSAGTLSVAIGGVTHATTFSAASGSGDLYILTTGTGDLSFIADATFAGTVDNVVVNKITAATAALAFFDDAGLTTVELRGFTNALTSLYLGENTGRFVTTAVGNVGIGHTALGSITTGGSNIGIGLNALAATTVGTGNVGIGTSALAVNSTGLNNVAIGGSVLASNITGSSNMGVGAASLFSNTTGASNSAVGVNALTSNTTGSSNTGIGGAALQANTTGSNNVAIGLSALRWSTTGNFNIVIGREAGGFNTGAIQAGCDNNTIIGYQAGYNLTASQDGSVFLGFQAGLSETTSNRLYIENSSSTTPLIYGEFDNDLLRINGLLGARITDATLNATTNVLDLEHLSSGTPTTSFGVGMRFRGHSATVASGVREMARFRSEWSTATDASRVSRGMWSTYLIGTEVDRLGFGLHKVLTNNSAITILNATAAAGAGIGGIIRYSIEVADGTDMQVETGFAVWSGVNKAGAFTVAITEVNSQQSVSAGTLVTTWAISGANPAAISVNANSSLTPSVGYPRITFSVENFTQQAIAAA